MTCRSNSTNVPVPTARSVLATAGLSLVLALFLATSAGAQVPGNAADYKQARKFSSEFLRQFVYDSSVKPIWVGETDRFIYGFRTSEGRRFWMVDPHAKTKVPLFDHDLLASKISELSESPQNPDLLDLRGLKIDDKGEKLTFAAGGWNFEFVLGKSELIKKDKAKGRTTNRRNRGGSRGNAGGDASKDGKGKKDERLQQLIRAEKSMADRMEKARADKKAAEPAPLRSAFSPDLTTYVFARNHNLYVKARPAQDLNAIAAGHTKKENAEKPVSTSKDTRAEKTAVVSKEKGEATAAKNGTADGKKKGKAATAEKTRSEKKERVFPFDEKTALQLSKDGEEDYSFGGSDPKKEEGTPVRVNWSPNSTSFYVTRRDSRGVAELFLVDSLAKPRPKLQKYKYPLPGEDKVRRSELHVWHKDTGKLIPIKPKWKDEAYTDVTWLKNGQLRVVRRDRLLRNIEYGIVDPATGEFKKLFGEGFSDTSILLQKIRYLEDRNEFIWWSERSGWGHYYLYGMDGKLKNPITRGRFRASRIIDVDEEKGLMWFRGNAREKGENIYYEHLYRVRLDGGDLTVLDAGDATHRSVLSKSRNVVVANGSRIDRAPFSVLRDGDGRELMKLEEADLTQLHEMGWKAPEPFKVKAADGVTDLYGNMWKPFNFDPNRRYPIIVYVYPGPQTEGVTHTFSATSSRQELAQLGFIVIQVGHRGGTPTRSKAYASYGYNNLRDYGLKDKKVAIEQLAARFPFIDIERVGIYGHSGGGFMTAAAMLQKPYNKFFKVGVASSGNHDNNVYGYYWAERYHGMKEVPVKKKSTETRVRADKMKDAKKKVSKDSAKKMDARNTAKKEKAVSLKAGAGAKSQVAEKGKAGKKKATTAQKGKARKSKAVSKKNTAKKQEKKSSDAKKEEKDSRFQIKVPTNAEIAGNLEGKLLLVHGELDNNVHPAGTMRLVDALIKANKRFDMLIIPGARHGYGRAQNYFKHRMWEYFAQHLLGDRQPGADIIEKDRFQNR